MLGKLRRIAFGSLIIVVVVVVACAGDPTSLPDASRIVIPIAGVVTLSGDETVRIRVEGRTEDGSPAAVDPDQITWTSSAPEIAAPVEETGDTVTLAATAAFGHTWVHARGPGSMHDSVGVWVQPAASVPSTYTLSLVFTDSVTPAWRERLTAAARRWEEVIRLELPEYALDTDEAVDCRSLYPTDEDPPTRVVRTERGTVVQVATSAEFFAGQETVPAAATACLQRPLPRLTSVYGYITINRAVEPPADTTLFSFIAVHELGHALGLVGSMPGGTPPWFDAENRLYYGPLGLEGYRLALGGRRESLAVEGLHWAFEGDVMSNRGYTPAITELAVGALMDLGYPAAWYGAGPVR